MLDNVKSERISLGERWNKKRASKRERERERARETESEREMLDEGKSERNSRIRRWKSWKSSGIR